MNDLLLIGLLGVAVEGYIAVLVVLWMVYRRPRFMMRWAVREAAAMSPAGKALWLAVRRGSRAVTQLYVVILDTLSPQQQAMYEAVGELAEALREAEITDAEVVAFFKRPGVLPHRTVPDPTPAPGGRVCWSEHIEDDLCVATEGARRIRARQSGKRVVRFRKLEEEQG